MRRKHNVAARPLERAGAAASRQAADGKARRQTTPRAMHADPGVVVSGRDVVALLQASNQDRLKQLIPVRHSRMLESPFAFFRGSAVVQAADLAGTPASGIVVQTCGDCHLMNFGGFSSPERKLVFDIIDFDETFPAPWEWDLKRLAVSLVLAARWRGFPASAARNAVATTALRYREMMQDYAGLPTLAVWYSGIGFDDLLGQARGHAKVARAVKTGMRKATTRTSEAVFSKITMDIGGEPRIMDQPPLIYHGQSGDTRDLIDAFLKLYFRTLREDYRSLIRRFRYVDAAYKVAGVGNVGTRCFIVLLLGEHDEPLFLQIKEARRSVLEAYAGASPWRHEGARVVAGQHLMQAVSDIFLGWSRGPLGRDYYVRQLRDMKVAVELETLDTDLLTKYGGLCGATLARAHAKAGGASPIAGYLGSSAAFDQALGQYALHYADQVERDYDTFRDAARKGLIQTETGIGQV
jgi:uncharacterized protein (DUF2252 family)